MIRAARHGIIARARARGLAVRIGLEDVETLPDGGPARDNAALYAAALALSAPPGS